MKPSLTTTGYYKVDLRKDGKRKSMKAHRLVAMAFIPNPEDKPHINHIDGNPLNNNVENLEWCTPRENVIHALETGLKEKFLIPIDELEKMYIDEKKSIRQIQSIYGVSSTIIMNRLKEYGIATRSISEAKIKYNLTEEFIINELKSKTQTELANEIGCSCSLISQYLKRIKERGYIYG